ncbi:hypothetical protein Tco_0556476 [Tanacetum coccineum]
MASSLGCTIMENKFRYLGVMVGAGMTRHKAWDDVILKLQSRLSKWKAKTLSIGGVLKVMESFVVTSLKVPELMLEKKISWIAWDKVLASKKKGGLGVSSYFALNRALLLKWVWRFVSQDDSLWFRVIQAVHGDKIDSHSVRKEVLHRVCRWWEIDFQLWRSFSEWDAWFSSILFGLVKAKSEELELEYALNHSLPLGKTHSLVLSFQVSASENSNPYLFP